MLVLLLIAVTSTWAGNIKIAATQNGTVTTTVDDVIVTEAAAGTTVTINVTPADGYVLKDGQLTIQEYVDAGIAHAPRRAPSLSTPQTLTVNAEGKVTFLMPENNVYISGATFISTTPVEFDKWVVAGSSAALNGKSWDRSATENLMSTTDGKNYTLVVTDAVLEKNTTYECKAVKQPTVAEPTDDDYIWRPYNNVQFTTGENETGKYTVTYTFVAPDNIETEEGQLTVALERTGDAEVAEKTYTVAGSSTALFGTAWDVTNEANDMVANPAVENEYVFTKENVGLEAGNILYKVVENHAWDVAYPAQNATIAIATAGTYNVSITFNSETKAVAATATLITPAENTYTATFKNSIGWDKVYAYTFNPQTLGEWPGTQLESVEDVLTISFKATATPANIIFNNGNGGGRNQTADLEFVDGQEYDMTPLTSDLTIYNNWATMVPAYNVKKPAANDAVVYVISDVDVANGTVTASEPALDVIPAGMPVLVSSENNTVTFTESGATIDELAAIQNMLVAGDGTTSYELSDNVYTLYNGTFYLTQGVIATDKAYLKIDNAAAASSMRIIIDGETTGIRSVDNAKVADGIYYNLAGQRLAAPQKGVNILNGRKVIIK